MARMASDGEGISPGLRWLLLIGSMVTVANIYYAQPLLALVARDFHAPVSQAGFPASFCQAGYALGMFFVIPLGDLEERRRLVLVTVVVTLAVLLTVAFAPTFAVLLVGELGLGLASCTPQLLLLIAAALSPPAERGKTVGFVVSGILLGILGARIFGGFLGAEFGWRAAYLLGFAFELGVGVCFWAILPQNRADHGDLTYGKAFRSLPALIREEPVLRESVVYGACLFGAFSVFWTALSLYLGSLGYSSAAVGLFGIVGAAGALAAPVAGKLADKGGPRRTLLFAILLTLASFGLMAFGGLILLVVGVLLMDVGVQSAQVTNLSRVYALRPLFRSRINMVYMTSYFVGGAIGSELGVLGWAGYRWPGVCLAGGALAGVALVNFVLTRAVKS